MSSTHFHSWGNSKFEILILRNTICSFEAMEHIPKALTSQEWETHCKKIGNVAGEVRGSLPIIFDRDAIWKLPEYLLSRPLQASHLLKHSGNHSSNFANWFLVKLNRMSSGSRPGTWTIYYSIPGCGCVETAHVLSDGWFGNWVTVYRRNCCCSGGLVSKSVSMFELS